MSSRDTYLAQFETNFFGVVKVTNAILPHFRERKAGTIVTLGSVGGIKGEAGAAPVILLPLSVPSQVDATARNAKEPADEASEQYCASKFALEGWSDAVRQETAHLGIKTIIFELGFHRTKMMDPQNIKTFLDAPIAEYEHIRNMLTGFLDGT
jgi:NAD(P)-dependent dehydrogenase (short-subunit alcohol dehydrogenase family)